MSRWTGNAPCSNPRKRLDYEELANLPAHLFRCSHPNTLPAINPNPVATDPCWSPRTACACAGQ